MDPALILASGSVWRRQLLERLRVPFQVVESDVDETPRYEETPAALVARLAQAKALAVSARYPNAVVIGADQVADLHGEIIGKPGDRASAVAQLNRMSGRKVVFLTGLCVVAPECPENIDVVAVETCFRDLLPAEIERYVDKEDVAATAGAIKSEGLGITLVTAIHSDDPTALIGLPLISLRRMLADAGLPLP